MRSTIFILFFPLVSLAQTRVSYKVFYSDQLERDGLKVEISYKADKAADSTYFHFSNEIWGEKELLKGLSIRESENPGYKFMVVRDSNRIVVYHPRSRWVRFSYRVLNDEQDAINVFSRPKIRSNYFHVLGEKLFSVPESIFEQHAQDPTIKASIQWIGFPANFRLHNSFGTNEYKQEIKVKLWSGLYQSVFVGGDFRIYQYLYHDQPVYFAIRGTWMNNFTDERIFEAIKKAIAVQREFWKDESFKYYTVIISPTVTSMDSSFKGQSMKGTALKNGFMIQSSNNPFNNWGLLNYMFNHELMHEWIGVKIANKEAELNYWFSEGFTDYYTYKNRLRSNDLSFSGWLADFNKNVIKAHWDNPERNKPNYIIRDDYWKSRNIEKLPYRRGALFAFWLDNQLMKQSNFTKSLDDLMLEILKRCGTQQQLFSDEYFLDLVHNALGKDISYLFQKHIISGVDFDFTDDDLIDGFHFDRSGPVPVLKADIDLRSRYLMLPAR